MRLGPAVLLACASSTASTPAHDAGPRDARPGDEARRSAEVCTGGADEDGDGLVDCDDPDCAQAPDCQGCTAAARIRCGEVVHGATRGGPRLLSGDACGAGAAGHGPEAYFVLAAPSIERVTVDLTAASETEDLDLYVFGARDGGCDEATCVGASSQSQGTPERVEWMADPGQYWIVVKGFVGARSPDSTGGGRFDLAVTCGSQSTCAPGDRTIACGETVSGSNAGGAMAADDYGPMCESGETGPEIVHTFTAPASGLVTATLSTIDPRQDLDLLIVPAGAGGACEPSQCILGSSPDDPESHAFDVQAGATYYLIVDGFVGSVSAYTLSLDCGNAPDGGMPRDGG